MTQPGMFLVALDVEGTLTPEAWLELQKKTGIEELKITTAHEPDYDKLMMYRINVLRKNGIKLQDMRDVVQSIDPLPGCIEFLQWLKSVVPRVLLLTDTFEEYAMPMFEKLGYPAVFCNSLTIDDEGYITGHVLRLRDQKRKAVESFQRLGFRVISVGDSFNDVSMLQAAERGILFMPSEKVVQAHPEFPVHRNYDDLRKEITQILDQATSVIPRAVKPRETRMWIVMANVSGTFAPEPWVVMQEKTGIKELGLTTAHEPDYDKLMKMRMKILRENKIKLADVSEAMAKVEPWPHAKDFLEWLAPVVPRTFMLTDTFEEYALPVLTKLGHPMVLCNFLESDAEGYISRHVWRMRNQKQLAVQEFQQLNFRVISIGYSFNDIAMMRDSDAGVLFNPSEQVVKAHPDLPVVRSFEELKEAILKIVQAPSLKRPLPDN
mmetsp:Transcript_17990/g.39752  ORF Transcript_17990/g.39752 Transcript_17990/m.39752 type:complete len:435 (-) Transcript_17990:242-1546(-)|eukprot:CAMPEP_0204263962 /NCGR_PEP_ID=MMETSP0468-20130131/8691_1 /ASSEMBLY_ACC=CAM_ASM_000383 /TAXON_ID=2969 /ORGANISM="Oxyrrhis marina" /LENGTH=434 /DNA_ID=CAMNT_0051238779 /DNA_START=47 /DNA_END=1351 /DNA_ORIENTATION=-